MYPFIYKIEGIHYDKENKPNPTFHQAGIVFAENYTEAMRQIESYYGEELIAVEYLFGCDSGPLIINKKAFKAIVKGEWDVGTYIE